MTTSLNGRSAQMPSLHSLALSTIIAALLACLVTFRPSVALGQQLAIKPAVVTAQEPGSHFDFFRTSAGNTRFDFKGNHAIPAGFFGEGSSRFEGTLFFHGLPLGAFQGHCVGDADTIMERKKSFRFTPPFPRSQRTEIELVALSLKSTQPIHVLVGQTIEQWDVRVSLSPVQPSVGSMMITQVSPEGGTASSRLNVFPLFTFERRSDGAKKTLDLGALKIPPITLQATDFLWSTTCPEGLLVIPGLSDGFCAGAGPGSSIINQPFVPHCGVDNNGLIHCHLVSPAVGNGTQ